MYPVRCWGIRASLTFTLSAVLSAAHAAAPAPEDSIDEVVVSATRAAEGVRRSLLGASVSVLRPVDLEQRQTRIVSDVLRDIPGVSVSRPGRVGA